MPSNAVGSENVASIVGYQETAGNFLESAPNLPQRIAIFGQCNTANESSITANQAYSITSAEQAGSIFGYGSPIHMAFNILRPNGGGTIGGIPTDVFPQVSVGGAAAKVYTITPAGTATANGVHTLVIAGRRGVNGASYNINVVIGDTPTTISNKINDAINNALSSPFTAAPSSPATLATLTSKWKGLTADALKVRVDNNGSTLGITYAVASTASGSGSPTVTTALNTFQNVWYTKVLNCYGTNTDICLEFENFNGTPGIGIPQIPTGRYVAVVWKPFVAFTGSISDDDSAFTDARKNQCTIAICPAPKSEGLPLEAAANMLALSARVAQDNPHLDVQDLYYPDMPLPVVADMAITTNAYNVRDQYVKKGLSCVQITANQYEITDFVTTWHPTGQEPPQHRYVRNIDIDMNVRYTYLLRERKTVVGKSLANDNDTVTVDNVVKPKIWKADLKEMYKDLVARGIIVDEPFSTASTEVNIGTNNPDRLETQFDYKRSGFGRILSTTAKAGFNFGVVA